MNSWNYNEVTQSDLYDFKACKHNVTGKIYGIKESASCQQGKEVDKAELNKLAIAANKGDKKAKAQLAEYDKAVKESKQATSKAKAEAEAKKKKLRKRQARKRKVAKEVKVRKVVVEKVRRVELVRKVELVKKVAVRVKVEQPRKVVVKLLRLSNLLQRKLLEPLKKHSQTLANAKLSQLVKV